MTSSIPPPAHPDKAVPESWGEPRSKTVTWYDPALTVAGGAGLSGLEFIQAICGGRVALAAAEIHDGAGRLVATATSNCLILPRP